jgi:hypothetical protein
MIRNDCGMLRFTDGELEDRVTPVDRAGGPGQGLRV